MNRSGLSFEAKFWRNTAQFFSRTKSENWEWDWDNPTPTPRHYNLNENLKTSYRPRNSFGLANLRMHASEDLGDVHDCSLRDGGGGDVDGAKADEAGGAHHHQKGECVEIISTFPLSPGSRPLSRVAVTAISNLVTHPCIIETRK